MADDTNNNSLVLKVTYGETAFLLMGDAEEEEEESLLKSGVDLSANVLKVGHHGSNTSTTEELLEAVQPECAAIYVGQAPESFAFKEYFATSGRSGCGLVVSNGFAIEPVLFGSDGKTVRGSDGI